MWSFRYISKAATLLTRNALRGARQQQRRFGSNSTSGSISNSPLLNLLSRHAGRPSVKHLLTRQRPQRHLSTKKDVSSSKTYNPTANLGSPASTTPNLSLKERMKKLSREYGWSAIGVYFLLSAADFPFCFMAVQLIGTDRIGRWEHAVVEFFKRAIPFQWPERFGGQGRLTRKQRAVEEGVGDEEVGGLVTGYDHGVREAQELNKGEHASIWTKLALAYAIHKSFIFIRVPATVAVTPKVVKTLRSWGWNIGKRTPKAAKAAETASKAS